jgi:hypothetical protein
MKSLSRVLVAAGVTTTCAVTATSALAASGSVLKRFQYCPTSVPNLSSCVYSKATSGSFKLGNQTVEITNPVVFQGGVVTDQATGDSTFYGATNGETLPPAPQPVTLSLPGAAANAAGVTGAKPRMKIEATAVLDGTPAYSFANFANVSGPALTLPVRIHLTGPTIGGHCYVGDKANPVTLNLTDGTTNPPAPYTPISGSPGNINFYDGGQLIVAADNSLVDNTFAVPAASGCGKGGDDPVLDAVLNEAIGLPAPAGESSIILNGKASQAAATLVSGGQG